VPADSIDILLRLVRAREFVSETKEASKGVAGIGTASEKAGKQAGVSWKSVAKWGGAAGVLYGAQRFLRGAVSATEELGKSTLTLNRLTGMDVKTSSEWAAMMQVRGMNAKTASMGIIKVSQEMEKGRMGAAKYNAQLADLRAQYDLVSRRGGKNVATDLARIRTQMDRAEAGGRAATSTLRGLGVPLKAIRTGNTQAVILSVADAFEQMENPARRAALAQKLFGRNGRELLPVLMKGRQGIQEQLDMANKYGATLGDKSVKGIKKMIEHQRELRYATMGVKVQLGEQLLPVLVAVGDLLTNLLKVIAPLTKNGWLFKGMIVAVTLAFTAYKVAMIASAIAQNVFNASLTTTQILMTGGIYLAVIALIAIIILLVKHWDKVKKVAMITWNWIKDHWPLLVTIVFGPLGLAVALLIKNFGKIKKVASEVVTWVKDKFSGLIDFFKNLPHRIGNWFKKIPGFGFASKALGWGGSAAKKVIPGLQAGGRVIGTGSAVVGERGPELLSLPTGARITPLPQPVMAAGGFGETTIRVPVYLDRRQIAEAVGRYAADKIARR
jgi:hypothetical protein